MPRAKRRSTGVIASAILALCATAAYGTTIQDLVRIKGHERNVLIGMGIVIGLDGTGDDSKKSLVSARPYSELLKNLGNSVMSLEELAKADAYAIVAVTMEIPATGVREGDRLDVYVEALFNAESLAGGRLVLSPLRLPLPDSPDLLTMAVATGAVVIEGVNPRSGVVRNGGQMLRDIRTDPVTAAGILGLVLKDQYAGYPMATTLAGVINEEFALDGYADVAVAEDAKNVKVLLPPSERGEPANFIATLLTIHLDPSLIQTEARIVINEKQGIILVTGNVEISPVGIAHRGLSITSITPAPVATVQQPIHTERRYIGLDTTQQQTRMSTKLLDLLSALDQLKVPVQDQIAIIYEMQKTGALHARIVHR